MGRQVLLLIFLFSAGISLAQKADTVALRFSRTITSPELKDLLYTLSDSAMEGREMGSPGQKRAADTIAATLVSIGYPPVRMEPGSYKGYFQEFPIEQKEKDSVKIRIGRFSPVFEKDMNWSPASGNYEIRTEEIFFVGYGLNSPEYSNFRGLDTAALRDKILVIFPGEPRKRNGKFRLTGTFESLHKSPYYYYYHTDELQKYRPAAIFKVQDDGTDFFDTDPKFRHSLFIPEFNISSAFADSLLGGSIAQYRKKINKKKPPAVRLKMPVEITYTDSKYRQDSENILGYIEGTDLKEEVLIISAHYDHLGKSKKGDLSWRKRQCIGDCSSA